MNSKLLTYYWQWATFVADPLKLLSGPIELERSWVLTWLLFILYRNFFKKCQNFLKIFSYGHIIDTKREES
ncbi:MAG: hypothetical protein COX51_01430 [Syntrophobacteraceae bacterium CG23_combo_of_CG06-09_8_20_14_all_50_8]|nr:MAG: hypothetical protein COX51_01430 [Syntrophobacteraceae bacterium CG23_combo_of_CG06-09_8_20_14_all_50_8]